eukprot:m.210037 g.210037  ORF g.210037 m.210037 type:complete len:104 (+) comp39740_c0_seq3:135-446(+)
MPHLAESRASRKQEELTAFGQEVYFPRRVFTRSLRLPGEMPVGWVAGLDATAAFECFSLLQKVRCGNHFLLTVAEMPKVLSCGGGIVLSKQVDIWLFRRHNSL